jgi:Spy/CpxP family protein refolding chaperone
MKKIIAGLAVLAVTVSAIQAQDPQRKMHRMQQGHQRMMRAEMNLSEEQKQRFKTLNDDFRKNMTELRKKDDITVKEWRSRMAELQKKHRDEIQNVFSKEQKERMEKMRTERRQMAEIDAKARMEKMKLHLGLSNEQSDKMIAQRKEMMEKMKTLRENNVMDFQKKREAMRDLMQKRHEAMRSILTEEQQRKMFRMNRMREMRNMHPPMKPGKLS